MDIIKHALNKKLFGGMGGASGESVIPDGYIKPKGTLTIKANGDYDVAKYAEANVNVPIPLTGNLEWVETDTGVQYVIKNTDCIIAGHGEIPESLSTGHKDMQRVFIADGVTGIGSRAFQDCSSLTSIVIPNSVTSIGHYAFWACTGLTEINIPDSVTSIGLCSFVRCNGLTEVNIPDSVTGIGQSAFSGCNGLTEVTIGNSVTYIGEWAFRECTSLASIAYTGTIEQWNAIQFGTNWNQNVPATEVICSDGTVALV